MTIPNPISLDWKFQQETSGYAGFAGGGNMFFSNENF